MTIRRLRYHRYGGPEVMRLEEYDPPTPAKGQVLVRVKAAAANAMDWKMRNGAPETIPYRGMGRPPTS